MSAYLMICLQVETLNDLEENTKNQGKNQLNRIKEHPQIIQRFSRLFSWLIRAVNSLM